MINFKVRTGDMELRSCGEHLKLDGAHDRAEIVSWDNESNCCTTLAYWDSSCNLIFVGDRFLSVDKYSFIDLVEIGQNILKSLVV